MKQDYGNNSVDRCGYGRWKFILYKPDTLDPEDNNIYEGVLYTNAQFHTVGKQQADGTIKKIVSVPTGNVAKVYDVDSVTKQETKPSSTKTKSR